MSLEEKKQKLEEAQRNYEIAQAGYDHANSERIAALNSLNDAQKAFDSAVDAVREKAPRESDWSNNLICTGIHR